MKFTILFLAIMIVIGIRQIMILYLSNKNKGNKDKKKWIVFLIFISYSLIFFGAICEYFIVRRNINFIISFLGAILCFFGIWLQTWSLQSLGNNWSFFIEPRNGTHLVTEKAYKYFRHPASLGYIFEGLGIPLLANTFFTFIFTLLIYLPLILLRVYIEERILIERFGKDYLDYKKRTPF